MRDDELIRRAMSALGKRRAASMTPAERVALASKAGRASVAATTPEQRKARSKAGAQAREAKRKAD